jgi:hypothetical protein
VGLTVAGVEVIEPAMVDLVVIDADGRVLGEEADDATPGPGEKLAWRFRSTDHPDVPVADRAPRTDTQIEADRDRVLRLINFIARCRIAGLISDRQFRELEGIGPGFNPHRILHVLTRRR